MGRGERTSAAQVEMEAGRSPHREEVVINSIDLSRRRWKWMLARARTEEEVGVWHRRPVIV